MTPLGLIEFWIEGRRDPGRPRAGGSHEATQLGIRHLKRATVLAEMFYPVPLRCASFKIV